MTLRWKDHTFRLDDDGRVTVDPPFTGKEDDPLTLSIKKLEFIVECIDLGCEVTSTGGYSTCALCARYRWDSPHCEGCPVKDFTDKRNCRGTPVWLIDPNDPTTLTPAVAKAMFYSLVALKEYYDKGT